MNHDEVDAPCNEFDAASVIDRCSGWRLRLELSRPMRSQSVEHSFTHQDQAMYFFRSKLISIFTFGEKRKIPVVPDNAVAEVSKIGNLEERLVVVNHEWQSESTDGPRGCWTCLFWSGCNSCMVTSPTTAGCSVV